MKRNSFIAMFLLYTTVTMAQWLPVQAEYNDRYNHVVFVNNKVGFIDGPGKILKTIDAGATWQTIYSDAAVSIVDISFLSEKTGFISAEREGKPFLGRTDDGGKTWKSYKLNTEAGKLIFISTDVGFMATSHGAIVRSDNGGMMWMHIGEHKNVSTGDFCFLNEEVGYFAGWYNGSIVKTTNGGMTWESLHMTGDFLDIYFPTLRTGYTAGLFGGIMKTEDEGISWRSLDTGLPIDINLFSIHCTDNNTCFAVGDKGTLISTTDGGEHWELQQTGTTQKLNAITCKGGNCYIVGDSGIVLKALDIVQSCCKEEEFKKELSIYPNPSSGQVTIQYNKAFMNNVYVLIHDVQGRLIDKVLLTKERVSFDGKNLGAGVFSCSLYVNNELQETQKLVIYQ